MHRIAAIAVFVLSFLAIFGFGLSRRPYYQAESLIYVQPAKAKAVTDVNDAVYDPNRYDTYLQQQLQTIVRPDVLADALSMPSTRAWRFPHESTQAAITRLQSSLKVQRVDQSYELSITLAGSNPVATADTVNAVTNAYIHAERSDELAQSDQQLQILQQELDRVSNDLESDRRHQAALSVSLGIADTSTSNYGNPYDTQLADLRAQLGKAIAAHDLAAAEASSVSGANQNASLLAAAGQMADADPGLDALKQTIGTRRSQLVSQMSGLTPRNPLYKQDQDELNQLNNSLTEMENTVRAKDASQLQQKLNLEAQRTADVQQQLQQQLTQKTAIATNATPELQSAADLAADITRLQARYTEVSNAINSIQLEKDTSGLVHILVPATPPLSPKTSVKRLILLAALPLAILFGLFAAVLLSRLDPKTYIAKDISRTLGFFPMATLPSDSEVDKHGKDEFILRLLAGIDQIHRSDGAQMFLFTAASAASGVTDLVASLARKMERLGYRIATAHASELLESHEVASGFFRPGDIETTPVVTHENFVVQKIAAIKQDADFLFIDAFPILSSAEAEFAARLADVVILVAESAQTTRTELDNSFALIKRLRVPGAAIVLTNIHAADADQEFITAIHSLKLRQTQA
jgi:uncharacterized protein involved in exopolysaccharide biosynthesis